MHTEEITKGREKLLYHHGRWGEYIAAALGEPQHWPCNRASHTGDKKFTGTESFEEAVKLATEGWPQGRSKFAALAARAVDRFDSMRPTFAYDVAGMYPVVPRYIAGDPENMVAIDPRLNATRHVIPIRVGISASAVNKKETLEHRGAAIAGLIDAIEDAGHSVELTIFEHCTSGNIRHWTQVEIKSAGEPLDIDLMAFAVTHPSTLRRIHFAFDENQGHHFKNTFFTHFSWGYGVPGKGWPEIVPGHEDRLRGMFLDGLHGCHDAKYATIEKAVETVLKEWDAWLNRSKELKDAA